MQWLDIMNFFGGSTNVDFSLKVYHTNQPKSFSFYK